VRKRRRIAGWCMLQSQGSVLICLQSEWIFREG
jgi:hypothetical protein